MTNQPITPKAYCSKKLLALLDEKASQRALPPSAMRDIVQELAQRGHYLTELSDRGLIDFPQPPRH